MSFATSALDIQHLPIDNCIEIAFIGYSNVGKSSAINTLANQKKLARISKKPGCTQLINLFKIEHNIYLVDLPGYSYSEVSKDLKYKWKYNISKYLRQRNSLKGLVVLMDIRYPMKKIDRKIIKWALNTNMLVMILLTKSDKLSYNIRHVQLKTVKNIVSKEFKNTIQISTFSSVKKHGLNNLRNQLNIWLNYITKSIKNI